MNSPPITAMTTPRAERHGPASRRDKAAASIPIASNSNSDPTANGSPPIWGDTHQLNPTPNNRASPMHTGKATAMPAMLTAATSNTLPRSKTMPARIAQAALPSGSQVAQAGKPGPMAA